MYIKVKKHCENGFEKQINEINVKKHVQFFVVFSKKNIVKMKLRTFLKAFEVEKKV